MLRSHAASDYYMGLLLKGSNYQAQGQRETSDVPKKNKKKTKIDPEVRSVMG